MRSHHQRQGQRVDRPQRARPRQPPRLRQQQVPTASQAQRRARQQPAALHGGELRAVDRADGVDVVAELLVLLAVSTDHT